MSPGDEFGGAIVAIDTAFDQCRAVLMRERRLDRGGELPTGGSDKSLAMAVLGIECLNQPGVVPILDVVVGPVMASDFHHVPVIVDQKQDDGKPVAYHLRHFLRGELERSVTDQG